MTEIEQFKAAVKRWGKTKEGELILAYLNKKYLYQTIKDEALARSVGQRDVLLFIKRILEEDDVQTQVPTKQ